MIKAVNLALKEALRRKISDDIVYIFTRFGIENLKVEFGKYIKDIKVTITYTELNRMKKTLLDIDTEFIKKNGYAIPTITPAEHDVIYQLKMEKQI